MMLLDASYAPWIFGGIQALGLVSAFLARLGERSGLQSACQCFFVLCLCLVGLTTAISLAVGPSFCLICGSTLSIMSVAAVYDCNPSANLDLF
jgi:hypothetical protein